MSFNYKIACASAVAEGCEVNRSNFFFDGKAMKKENHGTSVPIGAAANSDSEQCVGIFDGVSSPEAAHVAINCLRYFLNQKKEDDCEYINQLNDFYTASDRVIAGLDGDGDKRVSCTVGFLRYNGFYFATAGDCLVYLWRKNELNLLNPPENETRPLGGDGDFSPEPVYGEIFEGDRIVICTTAMKRSLSDDKFRALLGGNLNTDECVDALCKAAVSSGVGDCVSCCVIDIGEQTSEGYWILPGLVYLPEEVNNEILFEGDSNTIEITSGKAFGTEDAVSEEEAAEDIPFVLPETELPAAEPEQSEDSGIVTVDEVEKKAENKPSPAMIRRSAEEKKKQTIVVCAVIAGVLLLGLIMTFIIKGCAANPTAKTDESTPLVSDSVTDDEPESDDTTKRKDTDKTTDRENSNVTDEREPEDTDDPVSRDTDDTATREEPDDTTEPPVSDTDDQTSDTTADSTSDSTSDTTEADDPEDTSDPADSDTPDTDEPVDSDSTSDTAESTDTSEPDTQDTSDTSFDTSDTSSAETSDADVIIDQTPTITDPANAESN